MLGVDPKAIKPCPFCDCDGMLVGGGNSSHGRIPHGVECASRLCMAATRRAHSVEAAVEIWNKRVQEPIQGNIK